MTPVSLRNAALPKLYSMLMSAQILCSHASLLSASLSLGKALAVIHHSIMSLLAIQ